MQKFDKTVRPQDDLYDYVNNDWKKKNPIPPEYSIYGTFEELDDRSTQAVKGIIDKIANTPINKLSYNQILIKKFYNTTMAFSELAANSLQTLSDEILKIQNIKSQAQLANYLGHAHSHHSTPFWAYGIDLDDKDSTVQVLRFGQDGLGLPNRDFYLENNKKMNNIRKGYYELFNRLRLLLPNHSAKNWDAIIGIENEIAKYSKTEIELRDVEKNYNKFSLASLRTTFPNFDWNEYFAGMGWKKPNDHIVMGQPSFTEKIINILNNRSLDEIKEYLIWHMIISLEKWISDDTSQAHYNFYGKILSGTEERPELWKRAIYLGNRTIMGEIFGREYALEYFSEFSKKAVSDIVELLKSAFHKHIDLAEWMEASTKITAHKKLDNFRYFIGYPSTWHDFKQLDLCDNNQISNIIKLREFNSNIKLAKVGNPAEKEDWQMNAYEVNAYHDPNQLVVCLPAGILQPPFFDPTTDIASNLGGVGRLIGHEMTHGFDDTGCQFDEHGNNRRWQTLKEVREFKLRAKGLIAQASAYEVLPGIFQPGKLVIGEAIADLSGLEMAVEALKIKCGGLVTKKSLQKLFINNSICERREARPEYLHQVVKTDVHPPAKYRVNGTVINMDDFYTAFDVKPGDKLYLPPEQRVRIW